MSTMRTTADAFPSRVAGLMVGLCAVSPAFAAGFDPTLPPRELLLLAALALLSVALAMRVIRRREKPETEPEVPDMRWWKNSSA